jgi:hypothetical protein
MTKIEGHIMMGYKTFTNECDFLQWQREKNRRIYQVSPVVLSMNSTIENYSVDANTIIGIVVTYVYDEDEA